MNNSRISGINRSWVTYLTLAVTFTSLGGGLLSSLSSAQADPKASASMPTMTTMDDEHSAASRHCTLKGGVIERYRLGPDEVRLCWFGRAAIGEWTLLNKAGLAIQKFMEHPAYSSEEDSVPIFIPKPDIPPSPSDTKTNAPIVFQAVAPVPSETSEDKSNARLSFNPGYKYCHQVGGTPYRLKSWITQLETEGEETKTPSPTDKRDILALGKELANQDGPSTKRQEVACVFEDSSAIEIWTLFHGPEAEKNQVLADLLSQ